MNIGKILVLAAFAGAVVALFTTDKGKEIREDLQDAAGDWSDSLSDLIEKATCTVDDLQKLVSKEIAGLSKDAREHIQSIIDDSIKTGKKMHKAAANGLA
jgi:gas vesicle protein